tara:strand:- start:17118 stop:17585 length:468 start_codon:yes stop_codon:yes gene_type:complete
MINNLFKFLNKLHNDRNKYINDIRKINNNILCNDIINIIISYIEFQYIDEDVRYSILFNKLLNIYINLNENLNNLVSPNRYYMIFIYFNNLKYIDNNLSIINNNDEYNEFYKKNVICYRNDHKNPLSDSILYEIDINNLNNKQINSINKLVRYII